MEGILECLLHQSPKFYIIYFIQQLWGLIDFDWFIKLSVYMFKPLIVIYRRVNFVQHHWVCTMYINLSTIVLSLQILVYLYFTLATFRLHFASFFLPICSFTNPSPPKYNIVYVYSKAYLYIIYILGLGMSRPSRSSLLPFLFIKPIKLPSATVCWIKQPSGGDYIAIYNVQQRVAVSFMSARPAKLFSNKMVKYLFL